MTEKPNTKGTPRGSKPRTSAAKSKSPPKSGAKDASSLIDERIESLRDWRGDTLAQVRRLIHEADPEIIEEVKWIKPTNPLGVAVWSHAGIVCTGEIYKEVVKLTFARGASLEDPHQFFNSSLKGNMRRAIDIREGEALDAKAFKVLIQAAAKVNRDAESSERSARSNRDAESSERSTKANKPAKLLTDGNPQIAKADGDAPVQAYIAAIPGWKRGIGKRLDTLITKIVPNVRKAVKWNSPFYGIEGQGWFVSFHVFTHYVKVTFFKGTSLRPVPPGGTGKDARWIDIHEDDLDEARMAAWIKQAAELPGWAP